MTKTEIVVPPESQAAEVPCEVVDIELADGYRGYGRLFESARPRRVVLYLHGIQSHGGWFLRSCDYLRSQDITVLMPDRRGSGLNQRERGHCNSYRQLLADVDCWADWLMKHSGKEQIDVAAVSWGGKLALVYAGWYPQKVRQVALITPGLRVQIDIRLREKIAVGINGLIEPQRQHEIPLNLPELFTANPAMRQFIANDPLKLTQATASFFIASNRLDGQVRQVISKLKMPVHLFLAELDQITDNQATVDLLKPILTPTRGGEAAYIYPQAHHTLDFELKPESFFNDLGRIYLG